MYELTEDKPPADDEVHFCSVCQNSFAMSELWRYVAIGHAMRADGAGCRTFQHDYGLRCDTCTQQMKEEWLQKARGLLLLKREREKKEAEERKALYLRILSQNQQATKNET